MPQRVAIVGPTASGKSAVAMAVAERLGDVELVSIDSMQVYRGMDIGTAKPTPTERAAVMHHLVDILHPTQAYSAAQFVADARRLIAEVHARGRHALLVGGTMLYFKALTQGLDALPPADASVRAALDARAAVEGWPALDGLSIAYQGEVVRQLEWSGKDWSIPDGPGPRLGPGTPVAGWLAEPARWRLTAYRRPIDGVAGRAVCVLDDVAGGKAIVVREDGGPGGGAAPHRLAAVIVHPEQVAALPAPSLVPAPELAAGCPLPDRAGR